LKLELCHDIRQAIKARPASSSKSQIDQAQRTLAAMIGPSALLNRLLPPVIAVDATHPVSRKC